MFHDSRYVNSTAIAVIAYDKEFHLLRVAFHNGTAYDYQDVRAVDYGRFVTAQSIGRHYSIYIRNRYPATRVEATEANRFLLDTIAQMQATAALGELRQ